MRAFLQKFRTNTSSSSKATTTSRELEKEKPFPPLREWPPPSRPMSVPGPAKDPNGPAFRPLPPVVVDTALPPIPSQKEDKLPEITNKELEKQSHARKSGNTLTDKKVAFVASTPTTEERRKAPDSDPTPPKSTVSKLVGIHEGRASVTSNTTGAATPKNQLNSTASAKSRSIPSRALSTPMQQSRRYNAMGLPIADGASVIAPSLRAGTPFSQSSQRSGVLTNASWSEAAEVDLVTNIGQRERTRQEVLWEIVASEQRYVHELMKMKDTFINPLLHPFAAPAITTPIDDEYYRPDTPSESIDHLPIASRFIGVSSVRSETPLSPTASTPNNRTATPVIPTPDNDSDTEQEDAFEVGHGRKTSFALTAAAKAAHPRSPYGTAIRSGLKMVNGKTKSQLTTRSHQSLPPPARITIPPGATSTTSLGRQSGNERERPPTAELVNRRAQTATPSRVLKKVRKDSFTENGLTFPGGVPPHALPEDLRKCLEVIENGILLGHLHLSEALRKRYDEQYPLVRSLADVFVTNSDILNEYATYVLHLERALEQVDAAINKRTKQPESPEQIRLSRLLQYLDKLASDKGETGLAISLSKPFQRLLKYPLLFQNLLFHTDPSTFEYESTLQMVWEVEAIVRSIEDEKIQKEERDKTRDAFARIEGQEKDRVFAIFKPSRMLIEEKPYEAPNPDGTIKSATPVGGATSPRDRSVKQRTSFRRISEVLSPNSEIRMGSKKDIWEVVFNDVILLCQRTGTTTLPISLTATNARANSMPEINAKPKAGTTGKRASAQPRARNLYRFIKVESWTINEKPKPRELVLKEDIERWRNQQGHRLTPDEPEEEEVESDDSDRKSKMSFSYWGADKVTLSKPPMTRRGVASAARPIRSKPQAPTSFAGRESAKDAKFAHRMRSPEPSQHEGSIAGRPKSRTAVSSPAMSPPYRRVVASAADSKLTTGSTASVMSKPGWDVSTRPRTATPATTTATTPANKRVRTLSITSNPTRGGAKGLNSPAPSEDSGVGMYRQIIAQDPTISK